jgi:sodium/bile acid cotransporter 7
MLKRLYLPVGLPLALGAALLWPGLGTFAQEARVVRFLIVAIFLVNGYRADYGTTRVDSALAKAFAWGAVVCLLAGPALGFMAVKGLRLTPEMGAGLIVISCVAPTLSSGIVISENAGGDVLWATLLTVGLNAAGILATPFAVGLLLAAQGTTAIGSLALLGKLVLLALVPFALGLAAGRMLPAWRKSRPLSYVPSTCVLLTVWVSASAGSAVIASLSPQSMAIALLAVLLVHASLLLLNAAAPRVLSIPAPGARSLLFVASQKTLPLSLGILVAVGLAGTAALPVCILFHFSQLVLDSALAAILPPVGTAKNTGGLG